MLHYLLPDNAIAMGVMVALSAMFVLWLALLVFSWISHVRCLQQLRMHENAGQLLKEMSSEYRRDLAAEPPTAADAAIIFHEFMQRSQLDETSAVNRHLRAIFEAGWNESQLDVRSLLKHTTDELFRSNTLLKAVLSIFVVLGVLGTLFGLADTLATLGSLLPGLLQQRTGGVTPESNLANMLGTLKSAFAPSIWGVALTVAAVLIFATYLRAAVLPLIGRLEHTTLTLWIPQLISTGPQRVAGRIDQLTATAGNLREVAQRFNDSVKALVPLGKRLEAHARNRDRIDKKLDAVLVKAEAAFDSLSRRNEVMISDLDRSIGKPLRDELAQRLSRLDSPIQGVARDFSDTFSNFHERTRSWLETLQREFATQNKTNQEQLQRMVLLSDQTPELLRALVQSSDRFTESSTLSTQREIRLGEDMAVLSQNIAALSTSLASLGESMARRDPVKLTAVENSPRSKGWFGKGG